MAWPNTEELTSTAKRIIPEYPGDMTRFLGVIQFAIGVLLVVFGAVALSVKAHPSVGGLCITTAIPILLCGVFGVVCCYKKILGAIIIHFVSAGLTMVFSVALFAVSIAGLDSERSRTHTGTHLGTRQAMDICAVILSMISIILSIWVLIICSHCLYYGFWKPKTQGNKYASGDFGNTAEPAGASELAETPSRMPPPARVTGSSYDQDPDHFAVPPVVQEETSRQEVDLGDTPAVLSVT